jgi:tetratricopeptide (TPR) repeat protein
VPKESVYYAQGQQLLDQVKPQLATERVADARTALKNEDFDDAELLVEELQDLDPQRHEINELKQAIDDGRKKRGIKAGPHPPHTKGQFQKVKVVPAPLSSHEPPPEDAKVLYADGTKALNGGLFAKATELFGRCMMADKNFSMCYRAMGIAYAKSGNGPKAVRYYRLYLKVEPNARDAPQVKAMLQQYDAAAGGAPAGQ